MNRMTKAILAIFFIAVIMDQPGHYHPADRKITAADIRIRNYILLSEAPKPFWQVLSAISIKLFYSQTASMKAPTI